MSSVATKSNEGRHHVALKLPAMTFDLVCCLRLREVNVTKFLKHLGGTDYVFQVEVAIVASEFVCHADC